MKNKNLLAFFAVLFIVNLAGLGLYFFKGQNETSVEEVKVEPTQTLLGGDRDEHGCISSAGYTWCEEKNKCLRQWEEPCTQEEAFFILTELKNSLEVGFTGITNSELRWNTQSQDTDKAFDKLILEGKSIQREASQSSFIEDIEDFFILKGFKRNIDNISAGTVTSATGFESDNLACLIESSLSEYDETENAAPAQTDKWNIKITCGLLPEIDTFENSSDSTESSIMITIEAPTPTPSISP